MNQIIRFLALSLSVILITACGEEEPTNIGVIIDSVGKHPVNGKFFDHIEVREDGAGRLRRWIGSADGSVSFSEGRDLGNGWFIFAESEERLWIFYGNEELQLTEFSESQILTEAPYRFQDIPHQVLSKLPEGMKETTVAEPGSTAQPGNTAEPAALDDVPAGFETLRLSKGQAKELNDWLAARKPSPNPSKLAEFLNSLLRSDQQDALDKLLDAAKPVDPYGHGLEQ